MTHKYQSNPARNAKPGKKTFAGMTCNAAAEVKLCNKCEWQQKKTKKMEGGLSGSGGGRGKGCLCNCTFVAIKKIK